MPKATAIVIVLGLVVGVIGGVAADGYWYYVGGLISLVGTVVLYAYGIWKNPIGTAQAEAQVEATFSGFPSQDTTQQGTGNAPAKALVVPSNNTAHADARANATDNPTSSARAGGRER